jgi:hypothetical protein
MSRWKKLNNYEEKLEQMTVEELRAEVAFWKKRANEFRGPARKGTMKFVFQVQRILEMKLREQMG